MIEIAYSPVIRSNAMWIAKKPLPESLKCVSSFQRQRALFEIHRHQLADAVGACAYQLDSLGSSDLRHNETQDENG